MDLRRPVAALTASCALLTAAPAVAQTSGAELVAPPDRPAFLVTSRPRRPEFRMEEGDFRRLGEPPRSGLIAAVPLTRDLDVGIGRFRVADTARPRTHTETERNPAGMGLRQRSIAGVGFSLRFE